MNNLNTGNETGIAAGSVQDRIEKQSSRCCRACRARLSGYLKKFCYLFGAHGTPYFLNLVAVTLSVG
jgi:hypothetical protein